MYGPKTIRSSNWSWFRGSICLAFRRLPGEGRLSRTSLSVPRRWDKCFSPLPPPHRSVYLHHGETLSAWQQRPWGYRWPRVGGTTCVRFSILKFRIGRCIVVSQTKAGCPSRPHLIRKVSRYFPLHLAQYFSHNSFQIWKNSLFFK